MKHILSVITLLLFALGASAQQYAVYRVKGEASLVVKRVKKPLEKGMKLDGKDVVNMSNQSELKLFDEEAREMITLKNQCAGSLASIIDAQKQSRQSMTSEYFAYIVKNMRGYGQEERMQAGRTTAIFRNDADSLLAKKDSVMQMGHGCMAPNDSIRRLANGCACCSHCSCGCSNKQQQE